ncbi:hypothetical protein AcW1_001617 [Taiwanofungus camphoratus]|nr:hypothetical protein AcV7_003531 [Antrodia cinnamomea]KAI0945382.1 hypothetical protein AcW1_001617 [Antrodia cinnamomea]
MANRSLAVTTPAQSKCRLAEIVQYKCEAEVTSAGEPQFHCWPIPRIFRICPGRPAVEMTRFVDVDMNTGEISVPPESSQTLPKGKPWRDVVRYENTPSETN